MKNTRFFRLLAVASCFCLLPSCGLVSSVLKIPVGLLKTVTRTVGLGLTDDAPQPYTESQAAAKKKADNIEHAASQRGE